MRGLEIDEDPVFERRSQRAERIGTWLMVAFLVAATLGLLGSGPLSDATVQTEGLAVAFQRLSRYQSSEALTFRLDATATRAPEVRVWVDREYLEGARIEAVLPAPVRVEGAADRVIFVFAVAEPGRPLAVTLNLQPERLGAVRGRAGLEEPATAAALEFRQFVFP
ncbi:MAG TPA: hypothetical protein VFV05_25880 [Methylomirabilota bacterium]|nr:hypothetical protein [Methylomirabilota bacterium]